jgi:NAD(P)-dependent dehydrogenase (short-subunit alcohol dehydrogenase family)
MNITLTNKRVIVTGGTSGIGHAIAVACAEAGADVAFCGLTADGAEETRAGIERAGRRAFFQALDLSDLAAARRFAQAAIAFLGGLDGLVNNAGTNFLYGVAGATFEDIQRCFALNFYAAWALSQEAYPALKAAGGGMIVNMASIHAERTNPGFFPYNASKAAIVSLTKAIALEWAADNIRAIAIAPALTLTPLADAYFRDFGDPAAEQRRLEAHYPLKRSGRSEDVASLALYALSDANRFLSGNTILVDGGISVLMEPPDS